MSEPAISFEAWLSKFPDRLLASDLESLLNNQYVSTPEAFILACVSAYYEAQKAYNQNPEKLQSVELVSNPVVGAMTPKAPGVQIQKTTYSLQFETEFAIELKSINSWTKPKV